MDVRRPSGVRFRLPSNPTPANRRCITIELPDDVQHIQTVVGLLYSLALWSNWERDEAKTGTLIAQMYHDILDSVDWLGDCNMGGIQDIRLNYETCQIQALIDGVWVDKINADQLKPLEFVKSIDGWANNTLTFTQATQGVIPGGSCDYSEIQTGLFLEGIQGEQGIPGEPGTQGEQGIQGIPGEPGEPGLTGEPGLCECGGDENYPAPIDNDEAACGIAEGLTAYIDSLYDDILVQMDIGVSVGDAIAGVLSIIPVTMAFGAIVEAVNAAFGVAVAVLRAEMDTAAVEGLKCDLFCQIAGTTTLAQTDWNLWIATGKAIQTGLGGQIWMGIAEGMTWADVSRRAYAASFLPSGSCTALCDCGTVEEGCTEWDFALDGNGWSARNAVTAWGSGAWHIEGAGNLDNVQISRLMLAGTVIRVIVEATNTGSSTRLFVGKNGLGTQQDIGAKTVYDVTLSTPLVMNGTTDNLWIGLDYYPGSFSTHPQRITSVTVCYAE